MKPMSAMCNAIVMAIVLIQAGCAATGGGAPAGADRTGGLQLEMTVRDAGRAAWMYEVRADGTLAYAGGADVMHRRFSWTGDMTDEEIRELRELIARHEWLSRGREATPGEGARRYSVLVRGPGAFERARFEVRGEREDVAAVNALLHGVALRRLERDLERLPKPGPMPR